MLTKREQVERINRISIQDKEHLLRWLEESGRRWLIFNGRDLVNALPFPEGVEDFMRVIACYRQYRRAVPSGEVERQRDPMLGKLIEVAKMKDETLETAELDRVIRYCIGLLTAKDPTWKLENPPL